MRGRGGVTTDTHDTEAPKVDLFTMVVLRRRFEAIIREMVNDRQPASVLTAKAHEEGMRSLREDGIRSIIDEISTVEEVLKYT